MIAREPTAWNYQIDPPDGDDEVDESVPMLGPEEELPELDLAPCPRCGREPTVAVGYGFTVACDNCYDDAPDSCTADELASALTESEAAAIWNARFAEFDHQ